MAGNFFVSLLFGGALQQLFGVIRIIQLMLLQVLVSIAYPAHLMLFYQFCVALAELDVLNGVIWYDKVFSFRLTRSFNPTFELFDVTDLNIFYNSGSIGIIAVLLFVSYLIFLIV